MSARLGEDRRAAGRRVDVFRTLDAATARNVVPKFVEIGFSLGCEAMRH